ncbi:hypothetical protein [Actinacidiphila acididurans]|uniref:Integral membrane protein n=1 Tax=Actinacidiphila acididurans TaxID=2784346 RepID=A0ABS2TV02_9ACTN|nr:hypothetical protein [Actinacidiphila acididurans]MBM9507163.1 hypothetical protein [Actinacidiphila acididurans]
MTEERAYAAAVPCAAPVPERPDCLRTVPATVVKATIRQSGRTKVHDLELSGPAPASGTIDMGSAGPLLKRLRPGDRVTVTVWRHYAISVSRDGITQKTEDNPVGHSDAATAVALAVLVGGTYLLWAGGGTLWVARSAAAQGLPPVLARWGKAAVGAAVAALPAGFAGVAWGGPPMVAAVWLALCAIVWRVVRRPRIGRSVFRV